MRDSDGIRILSLGTMASSDDTIGQGYDGVGRDAAADNAAGAPSWPTETTGVAAKKMRRSLSTPLSASRRLRHSRRRQENTTSSTDAKQKIEAAAAAMAETQKRETGALLFSFIACDKR